MWVRLTEYVVYMGGMINAYKRLVGKPEGKKPFGRPRRGWEDDICMDLWT